MGAAAAAAPLSATIFLQNCTPLIITQPRTPMTVGIAQFRIWRRSLIFEKVMRALGGCRKVMASRAVLKCRGAVVRCFLFLENNRMLRNECMNCACLESKVASLGLAMLTKYKRA